MAEKVLFSIAGGIAGSLGSLANEEIGRFLTVGNELKKLNNTVSTIQNVLADTEKKQHGDPAVKPWLEALEDILYDADDLLDDVSTEARRQQIMKDTMAKTVRKFFSKSNPLVYRFKIARSIKAIRERLDDAHANRTFHLKEVLVDSRVVRNRERDNTYSFVPVENVIGREKDKEDVIRLLMDSNTEEERVQVISIVGLGGMGKTTLAQLIYEEIGELFDSKIWVCVSDDFDVKKLVRKILESITKKASQTDEIDPLVSSLRQLINGRKYLLVLDDVWNNDRNKWSKLIEPMKDGAKGSRVLVTTRSGDVAKLTSKNKYYFLRGLDDQSSWNLLKQVAFKNVEEAESPRIIEMGKEILKKCANVPLAIKTIGYLLQSRDPEREWSSFINDELLKICQKEDDILSTLKLSYDHLPSHLKQCFTYCSLFPKDYVMRKSLLIELWIAQGFIELKGRNRCLEDIGHDYFMDLLWGSFFQEPEIDEFGDVISGKMHDLMHDLATQVVGSLIIGLDDENVEIDGKTRHISVKKASSTFEASGVRTFLSPWQWHSGVHEEIFTKFKSLRSLDLNSRDLTSIPSSIGGLKHLRYLNLSCNHYIKKLPNAITRLQNLQTLNLSYCISLEELPRDLKLLVNLRHLYLDKTIFLSYMPHGVGQLTNLQTLSTFVLNSPDGVLNSELTSRGCGLWGKSSSAGLNELKELNSLRGKLEIQNLRHGKDFVSEYGDANLKEKSGLHTLKLLWGWNADDNDITSDEMLLEVLQPQPNLKKISIHGYWGSRLPGWLWSLTSLVELVLHCPNIQYLSPLCRLPCLKVLQLCHLKVIEYIPNSGDNYERLSSSSSPVPFFPSLETLSLKYNSSLEGFWGKRSSCKEVNNDGDNSVENALGTKQLLLLSFPRLSKLSIMECPRLSFMPMFPHLEELSLWVSSLKVLHQMPMMNASTTIASSTLAGSSSTYFSKLEKIKLIQVRELENLQDEALQNLVSLEKLEIESCHNLKSLSGIQHLASLKKLRIRDCSVLELANDVDWVQEPCFKSLLFLEFRELPKLLSLPSWLQHATNLHTFIIKDCGCLKAIPEWFPNYTASLQSLEILKCPILEERCEKGKGEDWPKIVNIPTVKFGSLKFDVEAQISGYDSG